MRRSTLHKCRVPGGSGGPATRRSFMNVYVLLRRGQRSAPYLHRLGNEPCPLQGRAPWPPRPRCRVIRSSSWTAGIVQNLVPSPSAHTRSQKERGYPRRDTAVGLKGCKARLCPQSKRRGITGPWGIILYGDCGWSEAADVGALAAGRRARAGRGGGWPLSSPGSACGRSW